MMKKSILIVDDDQVLLFASERILGESFSITTADSGKDALNILEKIDVDGIVLDIVMQGMNGIEFLQEIRDRGDRTPVIIATAHSNLQDAEKCADLCVTGYIHKPYDFDELSLKIEWATRRSTTGSGLDKNSHPKLIEAVAYI